MVKTFSAQVVGLLKRGDTFFYQINQSIEKWSVEEGGGGHQKEMM